MGKSSVIHHLQPRLWPRAIHWGLRREVRSRMKRIVVMLALIALLMVAWAVPASATANPRASCVGSAKSELDQNGK